MSSSGNESLKVQGEPILEKLSGYRQRLLEAGVKGRAIADEGREDEEGERDWRAWNQSLPSVAFDIARDTKDLVQRVKVIDGGQGRGGGGDDDFS